MAKIFLCLKIDRKHNKCWSYPSLSHTRNIYRQYPSHSHKWYAPTAESLFCVYHRKQLAIRPFITHSLSRFSPCPSLSLSLSLSISIKFRSLCWHSLLHIFFLIIIISFATMEKYSLWALLKGDLIDKMLALNLGMCLLLSSPHPISLSNFYRPKSKQSPQFSLILSLFPIWCFSLSQGMAFPNSKGLLCFFLCFSFNIERTKKMTYSLRKI